MENIRAGILKLLVAPNIKVHKTVHKHLWPLFLHKGHKKASGQRALFYSGFKSLVGHLQCWFHGQTLQILWVWYYYDGSGLCVQKSPLHSDIYNSNCRRNSEVVLALGIETLWAAWMCNLGLQTPVHSFIYKRTPSTTSVIT